MKISLFILFFFISACSIFIKSIDSPLVKKEDYFKNIPESSTYCKEDFPEQFLLVGSDLSSQKIFIETLKSFKKEFDFIDHLILWSLLQIQIRPDESSPTARLQISLKYKGQEEYFDFSSDAEKDQFPYLYGLNWIIKNFKPKGRLEDYTLVIDQFPLEKIIVSKPFEDFLTLHKKAIQKDPILSEHYFRGNEILKINETIPRINFKKVIQLFRRHETSQKVIIKSSLYPFVTERGKSGDCNYDFNLYNNSIFLIDKDTPSSHTFGLHFKENAFLASSSQKINQIQALGETPLFLGHSKIRSSAICFIRGQDSSIWMVSNQSRDPGQHLFHLVRYGLTEANSFDFVDKLLKQSRYIFLSDPVRLIIESNRGTPEQTEKLLKLNLPIYNADNLGNIWAYTTFGKKSRFIIDDRNPGAYFCK